MPDHPAAVHADYIDLFAGPGGWDLAAHALGLAPLGIECDAAACATRAAAGLRTLLADVAKLRPIDFAPITGLIASPPCPTFSAAGQGAGRHLTEVLVDCLRALADGVDTRAQASADAFTLLQPIKWAAEQERARKRGTTPSREAADAQARRDAAMSVLVVEPLRWALELEPEWIALEQVPEVLPLWKVTAQLLEARGYSVWAGKLEAERYGVPQTRERAVLIASRVRTVHPPEPTHHRFVAGDPRPERVDGLFGSLEPWVSMAEALGWGMTERPYPAVACSSPTGGPDLEKVGGSGARRSIYAEQEAGRWLVAGNQVNATARHAGEPAPTLAFGHNSAGSRWVTDTGNTRGGSREEGRSRDGDEPAPTITTRADQLEHREGVPEGDWVVEYRRGGERLEESTPVTDPAPTVTSRYDRLQVKPPEGEVPSHYDSRGQRDGRTRELNRQRSVEEPAATIAAESRNDSWVFERPATTVAGDPRVFPPGHKINGDDMRAGRGGQRRSGGGAVPAAHNRKRSEDTAVRVSIEEAGVLQSFPADYPWQGNKSERFRQVGNAVPPLLALRVLEAVIGAAKSL